jgi:hypothetical protein
MLRIHYAMGVAAVLWLQASPCFAAEGSQQVLLAPEATSIAVAQPRSGETLQAAASTIQGESDKLARDVALQQPAPQSEPASKAVKFLEYPALALLAMAIISMAALSRRDSLRIDR